MPSLQRPVRGGSLIATSATRRTKRLRRGKGRAPEGRHSAFPGARQRADLVAGLKRARLTAQAGARPLGASAECLPSKGPSVLEVRSQQARRGAPRGCAVGRPRLGVCGGATASDGAPGGEGILPSLAPRGAQWPNPLSKQMRLAAHSEGKMPGKMPSPPGPVAVARARGHRKGPSPLPGASVVRGANCWPSSVSGGATRYGVY